MEVKTLINVPVAVGELIDKITILEVKNKRLTNPEQLEAVAKEMGELKQVAFQQLQPNEEFVQLYDQLMQVNDFLWELEDEIRHSVHKGSHSKAIALITRIHRKNDERARIKKRLNQITNSSIVEVKKYATQDEV